MGSFRSTPLGRFSSLPRDRFVPPLGFVLPVLGICSFRQFAPLFMVHSLRVALCRDARSSVRCVKAISRPSPLKDTSSRLFYNGRTDRASLQDVVTASGVRCVKAISRPSPPRPVGTHDLCVRCVKSISHPSPLKEMVSILVLPFYNGRPPTRHSRASLQDVVTASGVRCVKAISHPSPLRPY